MGLSQDEKCSERMIEVILAHSVTEINNSLKTDKMCDFNHYLVCSEYKIVNNNMSTIL